MLPLLYVCFVLIPDSYILCSPLSLSTLAVIEESVPYAKWLNWKTKGNRKKSQHVKKKQMELAMHQRSPFVETRDGPAILSFGTYAPNGNLQ